MPDLLYEIGTEELPASFLEPALAALAREVEQRLVESRLAPARVRTAGTPRRMTVSVEGIPAVQPPVSIRHVGPPARVAFDDKGAPTPAARGFARSKGVPVESLRVEETDKGPYIVAIAEEPGRTAEELLPWLLANALAEIPFPKTMTWPIPFIPDGRFVIPRWEKQLPVTLASDGLLRCPGLPDARGALVLDPRFVAYTYTLPDGGTIANVAPGLSWNKDSRQWAHGHYGSETGWSIVRPSGALCMSLQDALYTQQQHQLVGKVDQYLVVLAGDWLAVEFPSGPVPLHRLGGQAGGYVDFAGYCYRKPASGSTYISAWHAHLWDLKDREVLDSCSVEAIRSGMTIPLWPVSVGVSRVQFARPIRSLVALLDDQVLPLRIAGVTAGRATFGHPFLSPGAIDLPNASFEAYLGTLSAAHVVADVEQRRSTLRTEISAFLGQHGGELTDLALLDEVTNMLEYPHAVEGSFDEHFLDVPAPVLVAAMVEHQRYFPVRDAGGRLMPRFITVSNRTARQDELVRRGNERVLLARLDDAKFFWDQDRRRGLEALVPRLAGVVFLGGLGNNLQRTERLVELAGRIAEAAGFHGSIGHIQRAARLCKADLLTGLVTEFPILQGVVGRELARVTGEAAPVAEAIAEHYLPAGADDALPATPEGTILALADKLDAIVGCFSLGLLPSGSQDPYALRRNALGILLIIEGKALDLRLGDLIQMAREVARRHGIQCDDEAAAKIKEFFRDRLYHAAMDKGFRHDFVRAVLSAGCDDMVDFWARLSALADCAGRIWWPSLVELVDRTYRIQRDADRIEPVREDILQEPLELELAAALRQHHDAIADAFQRGDYVEGAELYCSVFAQLVHDFFEQVFVNVEDQAVRLNRKSLCAHIYRLFAGRFADLYVIETAGKEGKES